MTKKNYPVTFIRNNINHSQFWTHTIWNDLPQLNVDQFRSESSGHRPDTQVKLAYSNDGLFGIFKVNDRYVVCRHNHFQEPVYKDSCVEFFLKPKDSGGYFNFEFNCGGAFLAAYITDPTREPGGFKEFTPLTREEGRQVKVYTSLPALIPQEITNKITWQLCFHIPFTLMERHVGTIDADSGTRFRANFFKCADECSHPHWAAWSAVDDLNFHLPHCFGVLQLL